MFLVTFLVASVSLDFKNCLSDLNPAPYLGELTQVSFFSGP